MPEDRKPVALLIVVAGALGVLLGSGAFTFTYADGFSYISDDPQACINCHVMQEHYDAWLNSSHSGATVCNSCHAPHGSLVGKYWSKAVNGFNHSLAFTTGSFPEHIEITQPNREIAEAACRQCHTAITHTIETGSSAAERLECIRCHASVGHGP